MKNVDLKIPTAWDQVTPDHLEIIVKGLSLNLQKEQLLFYIFRKISKIHLINGRFYKGVKVLHIDQIIALQACKMLEFILGEIQPLSFSIFSDVDKNLVGLPFGKYYSAEVLIAQYQKSGKVDFLEKAVGAVSNDKFIYNQIGINKIMIFWSGIRRYMQNLYPYILSQDSNDESSDYNPFIVLNKLLSVVNDDKPHDNEAILLTDVHFVLTTLNKKYQDYDFKR